METEIKALLLRFRDLATDHGDTIKEHQKVIEEKESVWWGWWSKAGEKIPLELFARISPNANRSLEVYFFHSDEEKFYRGKCEAIKYSADHSRKKIEQITSNTDDQQKVPLPPLVSIKHKFINSNAHSAY